ncbi:MAG: hypothetical protein LBB56_02580, partial [Chitinispirillales bacterium]|nr:hypothetical protein [Chitinispirillales bacterium]
MLSENKQKEPESTASILQNFFSQSASLNETAAEEDGEEETEIISADDSEDQNTEDVELLTYDASQRGAFELNFAEFPIAHLT